MTRPNDAKRFDLLPTCEKYVLDKKEGTLALVLRVLREQR
jgi:hypothetical protein